MQHYVYVIENLVNRKIYIGKHSTSNIEDGYLGSGKALRLAIKKYGVENFQKTVIKECKSEEEAFQIEAEIVDEDFVASKMTYNLREGGSGFSPNEAKKIVRECWKKDEYRKKHSLGVKNAWKSSEYRKSVSKSVSKRRKEMFKQGQLSNFNCDWTGRKHKEETKRKIGKANSISLRGERNSQYGKVWIYSFEEKKSMRVKKEELEWYLEKGWLKGRKIKFQMGS